MAANSIFFIISPSQASNEGDYLQVPVIYGTAEAVKTKHSDFLFCYKTGLSLCFFPVNHAPAILGLRDSVVVSVLDFQPGGRSSNPSYRAEI